mmetsp:Transcript_1113/g.1606  ORF Transcript_1113/g.1606 Transcript_1113/m.1606 type:complete len:88 (-) Transcript_1113:1030-1293(-)
MNPHHSSSYTFIRIYTSYMTCTTQIIVIVIAFHDYQPGQQDQSFEDDDNEEDPPLVTAPCPFHGLLESEEAVHVLGILNSTQPPPSS